MLRVNEVACAHDIPFASNNILANAVILVSLAFICNVLKLILTYEPVFYFILFIILILIICFSICRNNCKYDNLISRES